MLTVLDVVNEVPAIYFPVIKNPAQAPGAPVKLYPALNVPGC